MGNQKTSFGKQVAYKLRHKATGLFYDPQKHNGNVSEVGKLYSRRKPSRQGNIIIPWEIKKNYDERYHFAETELDDWEVVMFRVIEIKDNEIY